MRGLWREITQEFYSLGEGGSGWGDRGVKEREELLQRRKEGKGGSGSIEVDFFL